MTKDNNAERQAAAQLASILGLVRALHDAREIDDEHAIDDALQAIHEDALAVQVRSEWVTPGTPLEPAEFHILLCTGGPAVRLIGQLDENMEPDRVNIEHQDWFTPWTPLYITEAESEAITDYCHAFYFGA